MNDEELMHRTMPPTSIFDRLAHQGTAASLAREAEEKKLREEIEQRRAAVAATKALHINTKVAPPQDVGTSSTPIKTPKLTPQQQAAFFDRLAKQETVSSAAHHNNIIHNGCSTGAGKNGVHKASPRNHHHGENDDVQQAVYNRLYKQETASSKAHHAVKEEVTKLPPPHPVSPRNNNASSAPPPSLLQRSPPTHPPTPISMNLFVRTHTQKQQQDAQFSNLEITSNAVRKQINLHQSGKISALSLTHDVITELFTMDFQPGASTAHHHQHEVGDAPPETATTTTLNGHWQIGTAIVEELDPTTDKTLLLHNVGVGEDGQPQPNSEEQKAKLECFWAEKEAILDSHEIYSVAKAKAIIKIFGGKSIYVDEYQYTVVRREK